MLRAFVRKPAVQRVVSVVRVLLLVASLLLGCHWLIQRVDHFYAIRSWLVWRYVGYWAGALFFTAACLVGGFPIVQRLGKSLRFSERLLLAQATGVVLFFLGMFFLGMLRLYVGATFFLLPLALLAVGGPSAWRAGRRFWRLRRVMFARARVPLRALELLAIGFGVVCLVVLYSQSIHPLNTSYDARWYHLAMAEQYAAEGRFFRYPDGSYVNAFPHLASFLYTWAFLAPKSVLFDKVELCAHVVFVLFGWILVGVALVARRLVPRTPKVTWAAVFLFPGVFLYDSGLHLGADHPAAFFAPPLALVSLAVYSDWSRRNWVLLGILVAGAALTKYSVAALFTMPAAVLAVRGVWGVARGGWRRPRSWFLPPLLGGGLALLLTSPHWLKNWLFYGNPLYPYAANVFTSQVWGDYNRRIFETWSGMHEWTPRGTLAQRLDETLHAVPFFAFEVHDWPAFHRDVPVFGFLFSLTGLALPFVRGRTRRIWLLLAATYVGVFLWYWGMHQDRYLQVLVPWMAACTVAILVLAWRTSRWARLPVAALVGLQVAWGLDVPFIPGHAMLGRPPTSAAIELASTGYRQQIEGRLEVFQPYQSIAKYLSKGDRVLLHEDHKALGLGHMVLQDFAHTQGLIEYGSQPSFGAVYRMLKDKGVTHIVWNPRVSLGWSGYAGDLVFFDFLRGHTAKAGNVGGLQLAELRAGPDVDLREAQVAYLGCQGGFKKGLYPLSRMSFPDLVVLDPKQFPIPDLPLADGTEAVVAEARYVVFDPTCGLARPHALSKGYTLLAHRSTVQLLVKD